MLEALWSMKLLINGMPAPAGGVVVVDNGRVLGGDSSFIWVGELTVHDNEVTAHVEVRKYQDIPGLTSVTGMNHYRATFRGKASREKMKLVGTPDGVNIPIVLELTRQAELP